MDMDCDRSIQKFEPIPDDLPEDAAPLPHFSWDDKLPLGIRVEDVGISGMKYREVIVRDWRTLAAIIGFWLIFGGIPLLALGKFCLSLETPPEVSPALGYRLGKAWEVFDRTFQPFQTTGSTFKFILCVVVLVGMAALISWGAISVWKNYYTIRIDDTVRLFSVTQRYSWNLHSEFSEEDTEYDLIFDDVRAPQRFSGKIRLKRASAPPYYMNSLTKSQAQWLGRLFSHLLHRPPSKWNPFIASFLK